jgi:predicted Zn-dependent protease
MPSAANPMNEQLRTSLEQVARFLDKSPTLAGKKARKILDKFPGEVNAMRLLGTALRLQGKPAEAVKVLREAVSVAPSYATAHQELGLSLAALGSAEEAITALRAALKLRPELPVACFALGEVLEAIGDEEGSREAYRQHLVLVARSPELVRAAEFLFIGKYAKAEHLCREFLKQHPDNVSALRMLADIGIKLGVYNEAQDLLERAIQGIQVRAGHGTGQVAAQH